MAKKQKPIEIEGVRIVSKPQFLIGIISVTFIAAIHFFTFQNMKKELTENIEITKSINQKLSDQKTEFYQEFQKLHSTTAKIEGKLEILIED
ncbi:hypothetical protein EV196_102243 [Mariniflexile fucanivorans]|uniref:Uncharacterized protein n=1 Tax=Mariniflexile fucanivorans TaxID=264023 RepID=A0A4R1RN06_9FLAO|nr:hypothetical protein [Mariniflexile fucanivorans]TCL67683.1 hypothetical protein EV196_102243 [Mariniflexile fucanivorans]